VVSGLGLPSCGPREIRSHPANSTTICKLCDGPVKIGNPNPRRFNAADRRKGTEASVQAANERAQDLAVILGEFAAQSANATANALNERGIPTPRGGQWTARAVINVRQRLGAGSAAS
jgi:hypothetical protein